MSGTHTDRVTGVLLAAGAGRRMGGPKALLDLGGQPAWMRAAAVLRDGGCQRVVVVAGAGRDGIRSTDPSVEVVHHPGWSAGMGTSLRAALAAGAVDQADAVVVHLVDLPGVGADVVARLVAAWREQPDVLVHAAGWDGRRRNPVLFDADVLPEVAASLSGDAGARSWLDANADRVAVVDCGDLGDPEDLDTPADLARWHDRAGAA